MSTPVPAPLVSVVIPAYNAQDFLGDCLASVLAQRGPFALQVIVVDDGSRDGTVAIARNTAGVHCIEQANRGPSAARNTGVDAATGEFIAFLDADDLWPSGKLANQLALFTAHPQVALVFGDCRQFSASGLRPRTEFQSNGLGAAAWGGSSIVPRAYAALLANNFITTGSVVVTRQALAEAGGFAEDLRLVEDLDLWLRIARAHPIAWCAVECLHRRKHGANISADEEKIGMAYLEVLQRHARSWRPGDAARLGVDARWLASRQWLHLADLSAAQGQRGTAWARLQKAVLAHPQPATLWQAAKSTLKLGVRRPGRAE